MCLASSLYLLYTYRNCEFKISEGAERTSIVSASLRFFCKCLISASLLSTSVLNSSIVFCISACSAATIYSLMWHYWHATVLY